MYDEEDFIGGIVFEVDGKELLITQDESEKNSEELSIQVVGITLEPEEIVALKVFLNRNYP